MRISVNISHVEGEQAARVMDALSRMAAGVAMEGVDVFVTAGPDFADEDGDD